MVHFVIVRGPTGGPCKLHYSRYAAIIACFDFGFLNDLLDI